MQERTKEATKPEDQGTPTHDLTPLDAQVPGAPEQREQRLTIEQAARAWLATKTARTGSAKTQIAYRQTLAHFATYLEAHHCRLDGDPRAVGRYAQQWAACSLVDGSSAVSSGTTNQRLAILSSFYRYAIVHGPATQNPIDYAERPPRRVAHAAPWLADDEVAERLAAIDTTTPAGRRDKALIALALTTGRRAKELARLRWQDLAIGGTKITATFHCKGSKILTDELEERTIAVLLDYLCAEYGPQLERIRPESSVFVSYSNNHRGGKLSYQAISDIYLKRLGVSQVHTSRHSFAIVMDEEGASLSEIGERLGHNNVAVTADYLKRLRGGENKHAGKLARRFGI